jgi:hypothetical protein
MFKDAPLVPIDDAMHRILYRTLQEMARIKDKEYAERDRLRQQLHGILRQLWPEEYEHALDRENIV